MMSFKKKSTKMLTAHPMRTISTMFLLLAFSGAILLSLPIANNGEVLSFVDNLFTATSSVCVTGLATTIVVEQYSIFGQLVILFLIQVGGLGLMTFFAFLMIALGQKLRIGEKTLMQEALNKDSLKDITGFILKVIKYTFFFESVGFILFSFVFVGEFGVVKGLYYALFHAISAFCNAGLDLVGGTSFLAYQTNILVNVTTMFLIVAGGLGFAVWWDLSTNYRPVLFNPKMYKNAYQHLRVHTKIVLKTTALLLVMAFVLFLGIEYSNLNSIGSLNFFDKAMVSSFQSVTLRTAGFSTVDCSSLMTATKFFMIFFMFIGGSSGGTAGGIKTTTVYLIYKLIVNQFTGNRDIVVYNKTIAYEIIRKAIVVFFVGLGFLSLGIFSLLIVEPFSLMELTFEVFSAFGTVGLSLGITPYLTTVGKIIIILLMYIGRIGSVTLIYTFLKKSTSKKVEVHYPQANIIVG